MIDATEHQVSKLAYNSTGSSRRRQSVVLFCVGRKRASAGHGTALAKDRPYAPPAFDVGMPRACGRQPKSTADFKICILQLCAPLTGRDLFSSAGPPAVAHEIGAAEIPCDCQTE